jgi:hypothetical protein
MAMNPALAEHVTEDDLKDKILDFARLRGWMIHHDRPARKKGRNGEDEWYTAVEGHKGFPDLVLARRGRVIFAELKTHRGVVSPDQKAWLAELAPAGSIADVDVFVWRPRDWPFIVKVLR